MRRIHVGLVAALVIGAGSPARADEPRGEPAGAGIAGTYWVSIQGNAMAGVPLPAILTFTADGRMVSVEGQGPETAGLGTWRNEGNRSVVGSFLWFLGLPPATGIDGARYQYIGRVDFSGTFDAERSTASLPFVVSIFSADQNPLVDAALFSIDGVMVASRLSAHKM
jgi:hypothetical protein